MKYLVILAGSPRGGEKTWSSLNKYVLKHLEADLAICTDINIESSYLKNLAKYIWKTEKYEDFSEYYKKNFSGNWEEYFKLGLETGLYNSGMIHFAFKDMIKNDYSHIIKQYDYIIYSRFDQYYTDYHPKFSGANIWIPEGEDYFGICDRHAVFPVEFADEFLNICGFINSKAALEYDSSYLNCETTFFNQLQENNQIKNVQRFDRFQFTSAIEGDKTNWRIPVMRVYGFKKLYMKYPNEFMLSIRNLLRSNKLFKAILKEPLLVLNYFYIQIKIIMGEKLRLNKEKNN
tara:strand:+ start:296 stop:1162 length:867 start_codon:yes stop_codon:yes gene_type:complete